MDTFNQLFSAAHRWFCCQNVAAAMGFDYFCKELVNRLGNIQDRWSESFYLKKV